MLFVIISFYIFDQLYNLEPVNLHI